MMNNKEKYEIASKTFLKKTDLVNIIGTNNATINKYWNDCVQTLEKQVGHEFGPWGIPSELCLNYFGINLNQLKSKAEEKE